MAVIYPSGKGLLKRLSVENSCTRRELMQRYRQFFFAKNLGISSLEHHLYPTTQSIYNQNSQTRHDQNSVFDHGVGVNNLPHHDIMFPSADGFTVRECLCTVSQGGIRQNCRAWFQFSVVLLRTWLVAKDALSSGRRRTNKRLTTGMRNIEQILASVSIAVASIGLCTQLCWKPLQARTQVIWKPWRTMLVFSFSTALQLPCAPAH